VHTDFDVIVVGAGPGGATASRACAQGGLRTLLIEKERFPRYKACGGCLSVKTVHLLGFDLTPIVENTVSGAQFTYCLKDPLLIPSTDPIGYMVMRDRFDHFLVVKAIEAGVEFLEGKRVIEVKEREGKMELVKEPLPKKWLPDLSIPYGERYPLEFLGEESVRSSTGSKPM